MGDDFKVYLKAIFCAAFVLKVMLNYLDLFWLLPGVLSLVSFLRRARFFGTVKLSSLTVFILAQQLHPLLKLSFRVDQQIDFSLPTPKYLNKAHFQKHKYACLSIYDI